MSDQLTVHELIQLLQNFNHNAKVQVEGCDCSGPASGVQGRDEKYEKQPPENATIVEIQRDSSTK